MSEVCYATKEIVLHISGDTDVVHAGIRELDLEQRCAAVMIQSFAIPGTHDTIHTVTLELWPSVEDEARELIGFITKQVPDVTIEAFDGNESPIVLD